MTERWSKNKAALLAYATDQINLAQLYTAIGSPAGGKWQEPEGEEAGSERYEEPDDEPELD